MPILALLFLLATDPAKPVEPPPTIPSEVQIEFWRASTAVAELKPAFDEASADRQRALDAVQRACGEKFAPALDVKKLVCKPKADAAKK